MIWNYTFNILPAHRHTCRHEHKYRRRKKSLRSNGCWRHYVSGCPFSPSVLIFCCLYVCHMTCSCVSSSCRLTKFNTECTQANEWYICTLVFLCFILHVGSDPIGKLVMYSFLLYLRSSIKTTNWKGPYIWDTLLKQYSLSEFVLFIYYVLYCTILYIVFYINSKAKFSINAA